MSVFLSLALGLHSDRKGKEGFDWVTDAGRLVGRAVGAG